MGPQWDKATGPTCRSKRWTPHMNRLDACFPRCEGEAPAIQQRLTRRSLLASAGGLAVLSTFVALILGTALSGIIAHAEQSGSTAPTNLARTNPSTDNCDEDKHKNAAQGYHGHVGL